MTTENIVTAFFTTNGLPAIGLSPTVRIWELNSPDMLLVTDAAMSEVGDGFYKYVFSAFDPLKLYVFRADGGSAQPSGERYSVGSSDLSAEEISDTVWDEPSADHAASGSTGSAQNQILSIEALVEILKKHSNNRTKIDPVAKTLTVYEDDGITPMQIFDLYDSQGHPSVSEVAERMPTL